MRNTIKMFGSSDKITDMGLNTGGTGKKPNDDEVQLCEIWIKTYLSHADKVNYELESSYHLKHVVENWLTTLYIAKIDLKNEQGEVIENQCYVSNGAFIEAMRRLDFMFASQSGSINPYFCAVYTGARLKDKYGRPRYTMPCDEHDWRRIICPWVPPA
jgi:hypothetical protein